MSGSGASEVAVNSAVVPVSKLEQDCYDWHQRHAQVLAEQARIAPQIVLIGDSITHFWSGEPQALIRNGPQAWQTLFAGRAALNLGFGWDRTQNVLWRLDHGEMAGLDPQLVVLTIGTNNLTGTANARTNTPAEICAGILAICERVRVLAPRARLVVMGVFPRGAAPGDALRAPISEINALLSSAFAGRSITFLDIGWRMLAADGTLSAEMMPDGVHPGERGYRIWAEALRAVLPVP